MVVIVLCVALLGLGGFGVYQMLNNPAAEPTATTEEEAKKGKGVLGRMETPKNQADVLDNLDYALKKSKDTVAWLQVPGTEINGVVMQSIDNYYYERRDEDGQYDIYGCYFADYECAIGKRADFSRNTVIYGHGNATDDPTGKRFSQLFHYTNLDFAKKHPYIYLTTQEEKFVFEIFSVFYTDTSFDYIQVNMGDQQQLAITNKALDLSLYEYGVKPTAEDRIITLSTCAASKGEDGRFVVMGRLCSADFKEKAEISLTQKASKQ